MYRKYMTEAQARKMKQAQWSAAHTGIRVEQLYPQVEKIEITHVRDHTSFCGQSHEERTWNNHSSERGLFHPWLSE